ncbi:BppU family phage baseplate upper protein [Hathewaya histolytica]|uniref:Protein of uncharacterized function (DUF2479) n=1 Tax=Hathewaya histolytica TaxID=1498 RepID=A0A4U9RQE4_HATHI|nr:BppU family phage baseplate upper protein [Hathewaya histolytica]VTQ93741.1 protein of uncharacterised function (DUF2479) [Hathewaya histolytica]
MAKSIYNLPIDIKKEIYDKITVKQEDTKSRYLNITLTDNSLPIDLTGHTVKIFILKPDKSKIFNNVKVLNPKEGKIEVELTTQALLLPGDINLELVIYGSDNSILSSKILSICIEKKLRDDKVIESTNEFGALGDALTKLGQWEGMFQSKYDNVENNYKKDLTYVKNRFVDKTNPVMNNSALVQTAEGGDSAIRVKNNKGSMRMVTSNGVSYLQSEWVGKEPSPTELRITGDASSNLSNLDLKADNVNINGDKLNARSWKLSQASDNTGTILTNLLANKELRLGNGGNVAYGDKLLAFQDDIVKVDNPTKESTRITIAGKFVIVRYTLKTSVDTGNQLNGAYFASFSNINAYMSQCLGGFGSVENGIERIQVTPGGGKFTAYIVSNVNSFSGRTVYVTLYGLK